MSIESWIAVGGFALTILALYLTRRDRGEEARNRQDNVDKNQDILLTKLQGEQINLKERVSDLEGWRKVFEGDMSKKIEDMRKEIHSLERSFSKQLNELTQAIIKGLGGDK